MIDAGADGVSAAGDHAESAAADDYAESAADDYAEPTASFAAAAAASFAAVAFALAASLASFAAAAAAAASFAAVAFALAASLASFAFAPAASHASVRRRRLCVRAALRRRPGLCSRLLDPQRAGREHHELGNHMADERVTDDYRSGRERRRALCSGYAAPSACHSILLLLFLFLADVFGGSFVTASVGPSQGAAPPGTFLVTVTSLPGAPPIAPQQSGNFRLEATFADGAAAAAAMFDLQALQLQLIVEDMGTGGQATGFLACFPGQVAASVSGAGGGGGCVCFSLVACTTTLPFLRF